ncbi:MAG: UPF0280 family protein [Hyphomicrobiales bacterium]
MSKAVPSQAQAALIGDGRRLHLSHGPIDLFIEAEGKVSCVHRAYSQAAKRFDGLLEELVSELEHLRTPVSGLHHQLSSPVARRMERAISDCHYKFVTPMAAVAGSVADEILAHMKKGTHLTRAFVNNGGDIALHLAHGEKFTAGIVADVSRPEISAKAEIHGGGGIGGIATSGWRGRSHSLGIADAVTVLAADAACADAAATLIANAVDLPESDKIHRTPACELSPDSDLGERLVTTGVERLSEPEIIGALERGKSFAEGLCGHGVIAGAFLSVQGSMETARAGKLLEGSMLAIAAR